MVEERHGAGGVEQLDLDLNSVAQVTNNLARVDPGQVSGGLDLARTLADVLRQELGTEAQHGRSGLEGG